MTESTKNKIFWWVFALLILGSIVFTYVRIFVKKDYMLVSEVSCDSTIESCLEHPPEELCAESEDQNCLANTETEYYKIIHKKAANVADCDTSTLKEGESCPELSCSEGESGGECFYEYNDVK